MISANESLSRLMEGNKKYLRSMTTSGNISPAIRLQTANEGQRPYAIVISCSDSRVIPEAIFSCGIGDLFTIRIAGNVLDNHQIGSIEYAGAHLETPLVLMLGHTRCGAVGAAIAGRSDGYIKYITDAIQDAIGEEVDDRMASRLHVSRNVEILRSAFRDHKELWGLSIQGALYDIETGVVELI